MNEAEDTEASVAALQALRAGEAFVVEGYSILGAVLGPEEGETMPAMFVAVHGYRGTPERQRLFLVMSLEDCGDLGKDLVEAAEQTGVRLRSLGN